MTQEQRINAIIVLTDLLDSTLLDLEHKETVQLKIMELVKGL